MDLAQRTVAGSAYLEEAETWKGAGQVERDEAHCVLLPHHPDALLVFRTVERGEARKA